MPVPAPLTSRRTVPSPVSGSKVTSMALPLGAETRETAPARPAVKTGVKSLASTPLTLSANVTRKVMLAALLDGVVGFSRVTETTVGAAVSMVTTKAGEDGLGPDAPAIVARNAWDPSASALAVE